MCFVVNLQSSSQAGRRRFDPGLPLHLVNDLQRVSRLDLRLENHRLELAQDERLDPPLVNSIRSQREAALSEAYPNFLKANVSWKPRDFFGQRRRGGQAAEAATVIMIGSLFDRPTALSPPPLANEATSISSSGSGICDS